MISDNEGDTNLIRSFLEFRCSLAKPQRPLSAHCTLLPDFAAFLSDHYMDNKLQQTTLHSPVASRLSRKSQNRRQQSTRTRTADVGSCRLKKSRMPQVITLAQFNDRNRKTKPSPPRFGAFVATSQLDQLSVTAWSRKRSMDRRGQTLS